MAACEIHAIMNGRAHLLYIYKAGAHVCCQDAFALGCIYREGGRVGWASEPCRDGLKPPRRRLGKAHRLLRGYIQRVITTE
jgi:hypothetical protein